MKISDAGIELIKRFEGCKLTSYPDPATGGDPWTVGYGHTGPEVGPGLVIDDERADDMLRPDLEKFEKCVDKVLMVPVTQQQFDACVSLAFNIGCRNFQGSTLIKKLNAQDDSGAADQFLRWNMAAGKEMLGLTRRRRAERDLFLA